MSYLLDTNVVSELRKRPGRADVHVLSWAGRQRLEDLYLSAVTVMEIELGIALVERRDLGQGAVLREWAESKVMAAFEGRILPVDTRVAVCAAHLHVPDPRPERDAFIAATAQVHGMAVVTRNIRDFAATGVPCINPWAPLGRD